MQECRFYKKDVQGLLQCLNCSHYCVIPEGKTGICGVRQNVRGKLHLLVYGKAAAVHSDPVEKKPLFHFLPGSFTYSFGTFGCNFRCANCHNSDLSQIMDSKGRVEQYSDVEFGVEFSPEEIVKAAISNSCESISYTYNEPTVFFEYALDTMKIAKEHGLKNIWVSNGYMSDSVASAIIPYLDAINIDIKSFEEGFYEKNCGAHIAPVLRNCKEFARKNVWIEITTLIIPTMSDDFNMLSKIAQYIKEELGDFVPWHISAFSSDISWKLQHLSSTTVDTIKKAYTMGKETGLCFVYAGNVWNGALENTYCPECRMSLIERKGYEVDRHDADGTCPKCGHILKGIFNLN